MTYIYTYEYIHIDDKIERRDSPQNMVKIIVLVKEVYDNLCSKRKQGRNLYNFLPSPFAKLTKCAHVFP